MAKTKLNPQNEKPTPKTKSTNFVKTFLTLVGRPFYVLLSFLLKTSLSIVAYIGRSTLFLIVLPLRVSFWAKKKLSKLFQKFAQHLISFKKDLIKLLKNLKRAKLKSKPNVTKKSPVKLNLKIKWPRFKPKVVFFVAAIVFGFSLFYLLILRGLPSPKELGSRNPQVSTKIYDRNGNLLYKIYKDQNRTIVPLSNIPEDVKLATLAAEDAEFYTHPGFSIKGIFRAIVANWKTGSLQGGSTITQQLVKNTLLTPEKTLTRKVKEIILSIAVEATYTKDQILEMYLNEVSYGGTAYGIEEASQSYFGKGVNELNTAEAAFLAGLPKSPTLYSPFGEHLDLGFVNFV